MQDLLNKYASIIYSEQKDGVSLDKEKAALRAKYGKNPASKFDVAEAVFYMLSQFDSTLRPTIVANNARYDLLIRSLETNRVLSKDVLDSIKDQLEAIRKEEQASIVGDNED